MSLFKMIGPCAGRTPVKVCLGSFFAHWLICNGILNPNPPTLNATALLAEIALA